MKKKMPTVLVTFKETGISAIERSQRGIVLLIVEDDKTKCVNAPYKLYTVDDIPTDELSAANQEQCQLALTGYQTAPKHVLVYVIDPATDTVETYTEEEEYTDEETGEKKTREVEKTRTVKTQDYTSILKTIENVRFDYLVIPQIMPSKVDFIATWIKGMRGEVKDKMVKAVLPNCNADSYGVVNFTNQFVKTAEKTFTTAEYCSRVAGIIAGTPMIISCTYAPAPEVIEVDNYDKDEMDEKVGRGEFFFFNDGEKIKVARGVNSFVTTIQGKGEQFQKIKLVDLMDMIHDDIKKTGHDSYIGKYANSYDNRVLLITAINGYFMQLEIDGLLEPGYNTAYIDIPRTKAWLLSNGKYTRDELEEMSELEIKKANIHDNVFIAASLRPLDAIENINVDCTID